MTIFICATAQISVIMQRALKHVSCLFECIYMSYVFFNLIATFLFQHPVFASVMVVLYRMIFVGLFLFSVCPFTAKGDYLLKVIVKR